MSHRPQDKAAVLGLGIVGSRAYERLRGAGRAAACWNRTPKGLPGEASDPAAAVSGAAIVSIYLKDAPAVREVMEAAAGGLGDDAVGGEHRQRHHVHQTEQHQGRQTQRPLQVTLVRGGDVLRGHGRTLQSSFR